MYIRMMTSSLSFFTYRARLGNVRIQGDQIGRIFDFWVIFYFAYTYY
jgi:hypothetical protein